jgi:hypothetical protein
MNKRSAMKRKAPIFRLSAVSGVDYSKLVENVEIKETIIVETIVAIKEGINKNKKSTPIFEIADSNCYVEIERTEWKSALENVIKYYLSKEEYDMCIECRDLINRI